MEMVLYSESNKSVYVVNEKPNKDSTMDVTQQSAQDGEVTPALQGNTKFTFQQFHWLYKDLVWSHLNDLCCMFEVLRELH